MSDLRISGASASARTETDIRLNYGDPSRVIAAANDFNIRAEAVFFSTDGGSNWGPSTSNLPLASGDAFQSDPAVDWTSDGTAHALCIGIDSTTTITKVRAYQSTDHGANWTFEASPSGAQTATDREIIWVDHSPTSPFKDQVYATWHNGTPVFFARRTAGAGGNLVWATAYNPFAIPVAGGLLVRWGLDLPMSVGAVAMSLSTIIVAANAQLLRRLKLQRTA